MSLSRKQLALVQIARKELALPEDRYRAILRDLGGVEHANELEAGGFELVMQYLAAAGWQSDFTRRFYGHRPGMATPGQVSLIRALWAEYTGGAGSDLTLGKWLARTFKVAALRFLTSDQAPKAIAGLKAMKARKKAGNLAKPDEQGSRVDPDA